MQFDHICVLRLQLQRAPDLAEIFRVVRDLEHGLVALLVLLPFLRFALPFGQEIDTPEMDRDGK